MAEKKSTKKEKVEAVETSENIAGLKRKRELIGTVISDKMTKTIVISVPRRFKHTAYKKFIVRSKKYKAHDETNEAKQGDLVKIIESRPQSKEKRWALKVILKKATIASINVDVQA